MNDEQFEKAINKIWLFSPSMADQLRARNTAQREAVARVEAERDNAVQGAIKWSQRADSTQAQLAEAVKLLRKAIAASHFSEILTLERDIPAFLARYAQGALAGDEHENFEAWHRSVVAGDPPHEKYHDGSYVNQHVNRYWTGWSARAALATQPAIPITRMPIHATKVLQLWESNRRCCNVGNALRFARAIEAESQSAVRGAEHDQ